MKELFALLRDGLSFYRETLGHPDPRYRTKPMTIILIVFSIATAGFLYNYGSSVLALATETPQDIEALSEENIRLRLKLGQYQRQIATCEVDRDNILERYNELLTESNRPPPTLRNDTLYDRLEKLH